MGKLKIYNALTVLFIFFISFAPAAFGQEIGDKQNGLASWYGAKYHGRPTTSGEIYNRHKLTAAHNQLPLGSKVKVTNVATGESVVVRINDRGPFRGARIIDLSEAAARKIHYRNDGLAEVTVEVVELPEAFLASREKAETPSEEKEELSAAKTETAVAAVTPATPVSTPITLTSSPAGANPTDAKAIPAVPTLAQSQVYVVQAGSFGNVANATAQVEKLKKLYQKMPIALVEETVNGQKVHRILAGRFVSKTVAEQARQDLAKKGFQGLVRMAAEPAPLASSL
ncbi:septal ring lytic transglycosylase RlpA family protein [Sabulibacter ruber]|uniref:septal ring lytic transglycosylase RlpA family protein n=1 Tax=Sabulibacter ruber TaxID=2811901 RepID=UPI001A96A260|nr:septal ring lytic transglycosylase RlpA family protein [Sabulibacter ruber]